MDSLDILAVLREVGFLENARVSKIYDYNEGFIINLHKSEFGEKMLLIGKGKFYLTEYKRFYPEVPSGFCMLLRKHLNGRFLRKIRQINSDRIVELIFDEMRLVAEIFKNYNIILLDKDGKIVSALKFSKERRIMRGEPYEAPKRVIDFEFLDFEAFSSLKKSEIEVVKAIANLGFGGKYAEEIVFRAGVDKRKKTMELKEQELLKIYDSCKKIISEIKNSELAPTVVNSPQGLIAIPIKFESLKTLNQKGFESFNKSLDYVFLEKEREEFEKKSLEKYNKELFALEKSLEKQIETLENYEKSLEINKKIAEKIYENYDEIAKAFEIARKVESLGSEGLKRFFKEREISEELEYILDINIAEKSIKLLFDIEMELDYSISIEKNAELYYDRAKYYKKKVEAIKRAIEDLKAKMENLKVQKPEVVEERVFRKKREREWFEKFRWFFSSDGFLVIGGKDATSNEVLVKKYMERGDVYLHADIPGAPSVLVKSNGRKISQTAIEEAAIFAACFSKAWGLNLHSIDVFWVNPEQVKKSPKAGEFLPKGAFTIYGKRNYLRNIKLEAFLGVDEKNRVFCGPEKAVEKSRVKIKIVQGGLSKSECAKKIKAYLVDHGIIVELDDIIAALPPGECRAELK